MNAVIRYLLIAVVVVVAYSVISPSSLGGWVLYFVVAFVGVGIVEAVYRRLVST